MLDVLIFRVLPGENLVIYSIVRIEFSPVVEISAGNGHNLLQETTYKELTLSYA